MKINKLDAARRQLDCAIRLFFIGEDSLAVHSLVHASWKILYDLNVHENESRSSEHNDTEALLNVMIGWLSVDDQRKMSAIWSRIPNFLKHADRDPHDEIAYANDESLQSLFAFALLLWTKLQSENTPYINSMISWLALAALVSSGQDASELIADVEADLSGPFFENEALREEMGRRLIDWFQNNPRTSPPFLKF